MTKTGTQSAITLALEERPPEFDDGEQLDFLGIETNAAVAELRIEQKRKVGRPLKARNKRTIEMAKHLLSRYTSPLEVLAQIATTRVDELALAIGCTKLEALQEIRLAALGLVPYVHQKMPVAVDVTKIVHLTISMEAPPEPATDRDDVLTLAATLVQAQEDADQ